MHARIGIVLVDDARLRSYTPRAAVEWALRYETDLGLECTRGGTWFSQQPGSKLVDAEAYVSRTALLDRDAAPGEGPWSRAPDDRKVMATAGETRHLLRAKAEGWTTADFKGTKEALKRDVLSSDSVASSPFGVDVGPDAISVIGRLPRDVRTRRRHDPGRRRRLRRRPRPLRRAAHACVRHEGRENLDSDRGPPVWKPNFGRPTPSTRRPSVPRAITHWLISTQASSSSAKLLQTASAARLRYVRASSTPRPPCAGPQRADVLPPGPTTPRRTALQPADDGPATAGRPPRRPGMPQEGGGWLRLAEARRTPHR